MNLKDILINNVFSRRYVEALITEMAKGAVVGLNELHIDSSKKSVNISLQLLGEGFPVKISIEGYAFRDDNVLFIESLHTSKPWLTVIAKSFLAASGNCVKMPQSIITNMLKRIM